MEDMGGRRNENLPQIYQYGEPRMEVYQPNTHLICFKKQCFAAIAVSFGTLIAGFTICSEPLPWKTTIINSYWEINSGWLGYALLTFYIAGSNLAGASINVIGRKKTILAAIVPFIVSWCLFEFAINIPMVLVGRVVMNICNGVFLLSIPIYLCETIQPKIRGVLGLLPALFQCIGQILCFVTKEYMNWTVVISLGCSLPVLFLISMALIPETPRWFVSKGKLELAHNALQWLRGGNADVEQELTEIIETDFEAVKRSSSAMLIMQFFEKSNLKPLSTTLGLMFFQQFSCMLVVMNYSPEIFYGALGTYKGINLIISGVYFIGICIATVLIDVFGRKILLYISSVGMFISLVLLGGHFYSLNTNFGWPMTSLFGFVLSYSIGFGPLPWLMMAEILPAKIRGLASSVAFGFQWLCSIIIFRVFSYTSDTFSACVHLWSSAVICVFGLIFVIKCVPETKGRSLEDIERTVMRRV